MVKLVLMHKAASIYDDLPDSCYDFPRAYLKAVTEAVGDWIVYYEPVKAGHRGYFAAAKVADVRPKPGMNGRYLATITDYVEFISHVPRLMHGLPLETNLIDADGAPMRGGATQSAVRRLPEADFSRIVNLGLPENLEHLEATRYDRPISAMQDEALIFHRPVIERLTRRKYREVPSAGRCARPTTTVARCRDFSSGTVAEGPKFRPRISGRWSITARTLSATG